MVKADRGRMDRRRLPELQKRGYKMTPCQCTPKCMTCQHAEGERLKRDAHATLEARREVYVNRGRRALLGRALASGTASADDVRAAVELPAGIDPRCFGAVPGQLARAGIIALDRFVKTGRRERHASIIARWRLVDPDGARAWLAAHPDRQDADGTAGAGISVTPPDGDGGTLFAIDPQEKECPTVAAAGH